mgnify:CR=1 FL=1
MMAIESYLCGDSCLEVMKRGRPPGSPVRQNVTELLAQFGELHGYEIYKHYTKLFPSASMRAIYYSLRNGTKKGYFRVAKVEKKAGSYSWGPEAQRIYYSLGEMAKPAGDARVKKYFEDVKATKAIVEKDKKPKMSILDLKPKDWGRGSERTSEEVDEVLYGKRKEQA